MKKNEIFVSLLISLIVITSGLDAQELSFTKEIFTYKQVHGHEIKANIFLPDSIPNCPVLIYFHGGGFIFGNRDVGLKDVLRDSLLAHQIAVVSADYRLAPETKLDEILLDVRDCVLWIKKHGPQEFQIDTSRIAVAGGSAGGYLAMTTGFTVTPPPNTIIAISTANEFTGTTPVIGDRSILEKPGPYDIVSDAPISYGDYDARITLWRFLAVNHLSLYEVFGFDVSKDPERLKHFRLTEHIKSSYPPTLLMHAKQDHLIPVEQVERLYKFMQEKRIKTEFYLTETGHSTQLLQQNPDASTAIVDFLERTFK